MRSPEFYAKEKGLMETRNKLAKEAQEIGAKETLTAEEQLRFDKIFLEFGDLDKKIADMDKLSSMLDAEERTADKEKEKQKAATNPIRTDPTKKEIAVLKNPIRNVWESASDHEARCRRQSQEFMDQARDWLIYDQLPSDKESRSLFAQQDITGGYLVLPEVIGDKILKKVDNILFMLKAATVFRVPRAMAFGLPTIENDPDSGDWTTEISPITQDNSMSFGKRLLQPTPIRKRLLVSERFLRLAFDATFWSSDDANGKGGSPTDIIWDRMAYKIAYTWEQAFYLGTGTAQPLGMYVASPNGVSTARDVQTGSATGITYAGLVNAMLSLKVQYQKDAVWDLSRAFIGLVMKLVDTAGRPLLDFQTLPGKPTALLGHPIQQSEFTPNTFATGMYVGMFYDPSKYIIAIGQDLTMKKAEELYAETGQVGIFAGAECDGMPGLEEAFARLVTN